MKAYVLSIAGVVLLSAIVTLVLPNGKMGGAIRAGCKLVCLLVLIAPFATLATGKSLSVQTVLEDGAYLATCQSLAEEGEAGKIELLLNQDYGITTEVRVECEAKSPFSVKKVTVEIVDFGIIASEEHINIMKKVETACKKEYGCEVTVI